MKRDERPARPLRVIVAIACVLGLATWTATSSAHPSHALTDPLEGDSTLDHTVIGEDQQEVNDGRTSDEFTFLRLGPGEPHVVREELAAAEPGRADRRRSLVYMAQLTDFQLADEESPARVEFLDPSGGPVSSAWRPQESLVPYQVELTIRQVNEFLRSPVPQGNGQRARMANSVLTGDLADNQQMNETQWVVQLLEGGVFVGGQKIADDLDPNSGSTDDEDYDQGQGCPPAGPVRDGLNAEAPRYTGVQDYDDYPASSFPGGHNEDFWDPEEPAGVYSNWPIYEGLVDRAQQPFEVEGLEVPSYVAFGNHDSLVQGNQWASAGLDQIARGCVKVFPAPGAEAFLEDLLGGVSLPRAARDEDLITEALELAEERRGAAQLEDFQALVPPDSDRRLIDRPTFKQLHDTGVQDDAHGFGFVDQDELTASNGAASYYDFSPEPGIRYVVLDTVSNGGQFPDSSTGNIDNPQFRWLREKLSEAEQSEELVLVFAHHAIGSLTSNVPDEAAPPCTNPSPGPGCDLDPRDSRKPGSPSPHKGEDLQALLLDHPNVISLIAGHSHENRIQAYDGSEPGSEFWEIKTPAIVDWPPQHRLIEVMDNRDGTLSIFGTLLDDASAPRGPGGETDVAGLTTEELSSLGRTVAYNDPQVGPKGDPGARPQGVETDRNVELLLRDPRTAGGGPARCRGKRATIVGTAGDDTLRGTPGRDVIVGRGGEDVIDGRGGGDLICAGPGADRVQGGAGNDRIHAGGGRGVVRGGAGDDRIWGGPASDLLIGGDGSDQIRGGKADDVLRGGRGRDELYGAPGDDRVRGGRANDRLRGNPGADHLRGGRGDDFIRGDRGNDRLFGGPGDDVLRGGRGRDEVRGGPGRDDVKD